MTLGEHPDWLRIKAPALSLLAPMRNLMDGLSLHTVCQEAHCPNQGRCFASGTATFLIMGKICTRNCTFCAISKGVPPPLEDNEPLNVANAVAHLGLKHVVITSVTRDDLPDGGAGHFGRVIEAIHTRLTGTTVEVLIPDFRGSSEALATVIASHPDIINHNVETVPSLYSEVRPLANYRRSLALLETVKQLSEGILTKSGIMLGLGEIKDEVIAVMEDLRRVGCDCLTIGQYLPPSNRHHWLVRYVTPAEFEHLKKVGEEMGFSSVMSGPFVRSSFNAAESYLTALSEKA